MIKAKQRVQGTMRCVLRLPAETYGALQERAQAQNRCQSHVATDLLNESLAIPGLKQRIAQLEKELSTAKDQLQQTCDAYDEKEAEYDNLLNRWMSGERYEG